LEGNGGKTLVFLAGSGTGCPSSKKDEAAGKNGGLIKLLCRIFLREIFTHEQVIGMIKGYRANSQRGFFNWNLFLPIKSLTPKEDPLLVQLLEC